MPGGMLHVRAERVQAVALSDEELLARVAQGNHSAFTMLVQRHAQRFYAVAYRFTGHSAEAEDRVQEAFLKLWERPLMWQPDKAARFSTWFYRVVVNACLDGRRKSRFLAQDAWQETADARPGPEAQVELTQEQLALERAIAALPHSQRMALTLCVYEGMSNQQAADAMRLRLKALQSLLSRARAGVKENMRGYLDEVHDAT